MTEQTNMDYVDQWPDPARRERYMLHARETYDLMKELRSESRRYHVEYGKWLIASLLTLHGGAIYVISTLGNNGNGLRVQALMAAASWNIWGIVSIVLSGCMAWLNFQIAERYYIEWSDPAMLYRVDKWPGRTERKFDPINATLYFAACFGGLSIWFFVVSALEIKKLIIS